MPSTLDDNRALVSRLVEIVNARDPDTIGEVATGQIAHFRVEDGKLASATTVIEDNLTRMRQLGLVE